MLGLTGWVWGQMAEAGGEAAEVGWGRIWENLKDLERSPQLVHEEEGAMKNFTQGVVGTELSACGSGGLSWQTWGRQW